MMSHTYTVTYSTLVMQSLLYYMLIAALRSDYEKISYRTSATNKLLWPLLMHFTPINYQARLR